MGNLTGSPRYQWQHCWHPPWCSHWWQCCHGHVYWSGSPTDAHPLTAPITPRHLRNKNKNKKNYKSQKCTKGKSVSCASLGNVSHDLLPFIWTHLNQRLRGHFFLTPIWDPWRQPRSVHQLCRILHWGPFRAHRKPIWTPTNTCRWD